MIFSQIDPESFIDIPAGFPTVGRGAWTKAGIGFSNRYTIAPSGQPKIGTQCERSLDHWAVGAGCWALQCRLIELGHLPRIKVSERGIFGPKTFQAVKSFQSANKDPATNSPLVVDGIVGRPDARALFTPYIDDAERAFEIPERYLRGIIHRESALDPGSVGYFIYYPEYRGVDRGAAQINSLAHNEVLWNVAYNFHAAMAWTAERLKAAHDRYAAKHPGKGDELYWEAAVLSHNNPAAAAAYAATGVMQSKAAVSYVSAVLTARF